ncbi:MAG: O-antigen ligase family protein [Burkholderiaceae bacterium]|nr:O-antigen ligase family protein [Burkholderiaceae bacterium]
MLLLAWLLAGGFVQRWQVLRRDPLSWICVLLFGTVVVASAWTAAPADTVVGHIQKYSKLLFVPVAVSLLQEARWRERALLAFTAAMLLTLAASMLHVVWDFPGAKGSGTGLHGNHHIFTNYISQNVMMSFMVLVALTRAAQPADPQAGGWRWFWLAVALVGIVNIGFFVGGRTGYLTLAASLFIFAWLASSRTSRMWLVSTLVVGGLLMAASSDRLQERVTQAAQEVQTRHEDGNATSIGLRLGFWEGSLRLIAQRPLTGTGTGSYSQAFCTAMPAEWCNLPANGHPHNQLLHSWVEQGLAGALLVLALLALPFLAAARCHGARRTLLLGLGATFFIHSMLNPSIFHIDGLFFLMMFSVLLAGLDFSPHRSGTAAARTPPA